MSLRGVPIEDRLEQIELAVGRALPIEAFGITPGVGPRRRRGEKSAHRIGDPVGRRVGDNSPRLGRADNIGDAREVGNDHRSAASHAFQQDVGPAFVPGDEQEGVGRAVDRWQPILRDAAEHSDPLGDAALARQLPDCCSFRPFADNDELDGRQPGERLDHQVMALQGDQVADREKGGAGQAQGLPSRRAVAGAEEREVHPVAQDSHTLGADPELDQSLLQPVRHRDQAIRPLRRPAHPAARPGIAGDQIEIAAAGGDHHRTAQRTAEQHGSYPIRIKIMGIDQIELLPLAQLPAKKRQNGGIQYERRHIHADPGG